MQKKMLVSWFNAYSQGLHGNTLNNTEKPDKSETQKASKRAERADKDRKNDNLCNEKEHCEAQTNHATDRLQGGAGLLFWDCDEGPAVV